MDAQGDSPISLQGSIHRFSVADVLQFLAQKDASGVLQIHDCEEHAFVYLVDGRVEGISMPVSDARLGTRLVRAGCLSEPQLTEAIREDSTLSREQKRLKPLGQRLVEKGLASESGLRDVLRRQTLDHVFELAQWQDGVFAYNETTVMPQFQVMIRGNVQNLLLAVHRRIDGGERARKAARAVAENAACLGCSLADKCTPEIKVQYLKKDTCLWRRLKPRVGNHWNLFLDPSYGPLDDDEYELSLEAELLDSLSDDPYGLLRSRRKQREAPKQPFEVPL